MVKTVNTEPYGVVIAWLRRSRKTRELTVREVAQRLDVSHTWVVKVENGARRLDLFEYARLCTVLGVDPHEGVQMLCAMNLFPKGRNKAAIPEKKPRGRKPKAVVAVVAEPKKRGRKPNAEKVAPVAATPEPKKAVKVKAAPVKKAGRAKK